MSFPNFTFWPHLPATVGVEVCCLAALGLVAQRFFRSAVWQRTVWQMTVVCLLLLPVSEWTGFGRGAAGFLFGQLRESWNTSPGALLLLAALDDKQTARSSMAATNQVHATQGRGEILAKLNRIRLNEVSFDLPLSEVVNLLRAESKERDPDGVGVNFMINPRAIANAGAPPVELSRVRIKISPPLRNLRMLDLLNVMTKVANPPIWFSVDDYAVMFWPKPPGQAALFTEVFKVDPNTFVQGLSGVSAINLRPGTTSAGGGGSGDSSAGSGVTIPSVQVAPAAQGGNSTERINETVKDYFTASGVDLTDPGKTLFFNNRTGELLVRATLTDLETVRSAVELLNQQPPQMLITATFVELSQEDVRALGLNWVLGSNTFMKIPTMANEAGIMSDLQYRTAINAIKQRAGAVLLAAPKVTTLSGRQTHIAMSDGDKGVALDVIAGVGPDGFSIQTTAVPSIKTGKETWQIGASHKLWDGQTLVVGGVMTNQLPGAGKVRMVFVTPRIINPMGNPVHSDAELSKRPGIPAQ
jgi:hypothetical protein